jgi:cell division septation protein DedD
MTSRTYRTAQGKTVDLGQLILQNENVRAVGNMNVNARGDRLDSSNRVIDSKNQQVQRQHQRQIATNVSDQTVHTSNVHARRAKKAAEEDAVDTTTTTPVDTTPVDTTPAGGGLAAAIARSRTVVQEKEKTPREIKQFKPGVNRI